MPSKSIRLIILGVSLLLALIIVPKVIGSITGGFGYFNHRVASDQVGVRLLRNKPVEILGPGVYLDWGPHNMFQFKDITDINVHGLPFVFEDDEVLTKDRQRIGIAIAGAVVRPSLLQANTLLANWATYRQFYQDDQILVGYVSGKDKDNKDIFKPGLIQSLSGQAAKVCIGDRNFDDAVVGSARDALKECIDTELDKLGAGYGLTIQNVVVPNIVLAPDVQKQLDAITTARLATTVAQQQALQATSEAEKNAATTKGSIAVEQSKAQELARQQAITATLAVTAAQAQSKQIEAEKANSLLISQKDKDIAEARRQVALVDAQATIAAEQAKAQMYQSNPAYTQLAEVQAQASAIKSGDKIYVVAPGTNPLTVLGNPGATIVQPK